MNFSYHLLLPFKTDSFHVRYNASGAAFTLRPVMYDMYDASRFGLKPRPTMLFTLHYIVYLFVMGQVSVPGTSGGKIKIGGSYL